MAALGLFVTSCCMGRDYSGTMHRIRRAHCKPESRAGGFRRGREGGEPSSIIRDGDWKLIRYYEDGREELYHLREDIGEQNDVAKSNPAVVSELSQKLDAWLKETGAKIPLMDDRFDGVKKEKQLQQAKTTEVMKLEKQHANFLSPDFEPDKTWWDSKATKD